MILFGLPRMTGLAAALAPLAELRRGRAVIGRFPNGELHATVETPVAGQECLLLGSVAPPDEDLLATLLLAHTLVKEGAGTLTVLLPYLGYSRHDRAQPGKSLGTAWLGALLQASGAQEVITVDVHSAQAARLFPILLHSLSPAALFAVEVGRGGVDDVSVVAPDEGAIARGEAVRAAAGVPRPLAHFTKTRTEHGVAHTALHGPVAPRVVLVDDILDTGGTLVSACERLVDLGVHDIRVMVTHGLFTGTGWQRLRALRVSAIYCTDTVAPPPGAEPVTVLSVAPLMAAHLRSRVGVAAV